MVHNCQCVVHNFLVHRCYLGKRFNGLLNRGRLSIFSSESISIDYELVWELVWTGSGLRSVMNERIREGSPTIP